MTESHLATCDQCDKRYRVPDPDKTYSCKACEGGRVRVAGPEAAPAGRRATPARPSAEERREAKRDDRRRASGEIKRAQKSLNFMRFALWCTIGFGVYMLMIFLVVMQVLSSWDNGDTFKFSEHLIITLIPTTLIAVSAMALIHMRFNALPWALALAGLWTLGFGSLLVATGGWLPAMLLIPLLLCGVVLWSSVWSAWKLNKLVQQYPDLYASHSARGSLSDRPIRGDSRTRVRDSRKAMRSAGVSTLKKAIVVGGGIYALGIFTAYTTYAGNDFVREPEELVADFREVWSTNDYAEIGDETHDDWRAALIERVHESVTDNGWTTWPELGEPTINVTDIDVEASYPIGFPHGELRVSWRRHLGAWHLKGIRIPPIALKRADEQFKRAWNSSSTDGVTALMREESQVDFPRKFAKVLERRNWTDDWPNIVSMDEPTYPGSGKAKVECELATGQSMTVSFKLEKGKWYFSGLKPPKS